MSNRARLRRPREPVTVSRPGTVTFEEFCAVVSEDQKADLIDGVIYMASPESFDHQRLFVWLLTLMNMYARRRRLGEVFGSRAAFRLEERGGPEPDVAFVSSDRIALVRHGYFDGPPDLAIEIVSPDSVQRDYEEKKQQYRKHGVKEYWIVDEDLKAVTLLRLDARGRYREVRPRNGILRSDVLDGFWLRPEWLWTETRPEVDEILAQLLA